jgi:hypothetical protein
VWQPLVALRFHLFQQGLTYGPMRQSDYSAALALKLTSEQLIHYHKPSFLLSGISNAAIRHFRRLGPDHVYDGGR